MPQKAILEAEPFDTLGGDFMGPFPPLTIISIFLWWRMIMMLCVLSLQAILSISLEPHKLLLAMGEIFL